MGFWIFMLLFSLLLPLMLIGFGRLFTRRAPKEINYLFGYRTDRSMKNMDTWTFAHRYLGRRWLIWGCILLPVTVVAMLLQLGGTKDAIGTTASVMIFAQMVPLVGCIIPTEAALKRTFDRDGNRRDGSAPHDDADT